MPDHATMYKNYRGCTGNAKETRAYKEALKAYKKCEGMHMGVEETQGDVKRNAKELHRNTKKCKGVTGHATKRKKLQDMQGAAKN